MEKHILDVATKHHLLEELKDKTFIHKELHKLLKSPFYYSIVHDNILLKFIPVSKFKPKDAHILMGRLIYVAKQESITHNVHMWLIPCNSKRYFPKCDDGELFDEKHINGGYTYYRRDNHDTYIYRIEDLQKVAIHELLHNSKLDKTDTDATELLESFRISPNSPFPLLINEASIEAWAMFYHLKCIADHEKPFKQLFKEELEFSLALSHKLLVNYHKDLWKEHTNTYSYIRLKTCIMFHWSKFVKSDNLVEFLKKYNTCSRFIKAICKRKIPKSNSCKITKYGSY
jgi:hypothetical protein